MVAKLTEVQNSLSEQDFCLWLSTTVELLCDGNFQGLDLPNLIEKIEEMGKSERNAVTSNLIRILQHLLKYKFQPEKRSNIWKFSLREHRLRVNRALQDSSSFKNHLTEILPSSYQDARKLAAKETGLSLNNFPVEVPFTVEEIIDTEIY